MMQGEIMKSAKSSEKAFPTGSIYWIRFTLGISVGLICGVLQLGLEGILMGIVVYTVSLLAIFFVYGIHSNIGGQERAYYIMGLATYIVVWFTAWIFLHSLIVY
jgi:hypothetical protein